MNLHVYYSKRTLVTRITFFLIAEVESEAVEMESSEEDSFVFRKEEDSAFLFAD